MSMSDLREYKCPACGGAIEFDSKSQKMKCPYCDTEFELETLKELDAQMEREAGQQDIPVSPVVVRLSQMRIQEHQIVRIVEIP